MVAQTRECGGGGGGGDGGLIKLFGQTIPVREAGDAASKDLEQSGSSSAESGVHEKSDADESSPALSAGDEVAGGEKGKLKKPDKILPCPRCSSMDTKFCYFNNYNVNQPRHFCKNCQRYWTAGGAMRNVPVGAGRRKNKNAVAVAASQFLQRVRHDPPPVKASGTVLSFSHDGSSAVDLAEQMAHLKENLVPPPPINLRGNAAGDNPPSAGSCGEVSSNTLENNQSSCCAGGRDRVTAQKTADGVHQQGMIGGGAMWPYGCVQSPTAAAAAYYTIPVYAGAAGFWGCMVPGAWSLPWPVQCQSQALSSPTSASSVTSGHSSLALGKHPREDDEGRGGHGSGKVWVPKTIRIDNADEVARSSIRSLFGIKHGGDRVETCTGGQKLATVFEQKQGGSKTAKHAAAPSLSRHVNPVALTRSVTFHEGS